MAKIVKEPGQIDRHLSKVEVEEVGRADAEEIIASGSYDILRTYVELKRYESYLRGLVAGLKPGATEIALSYDRKEIELNDSRIKVGKSRKYNYAVDTVWEDLHQRIEQLRNEQKEREEFLRTHRGQSSVLDKSTGEIIDRVELPAEEEDRILVYL